MLENARKKWDFRPTLTNPLVKNYETYNVNDTLWSTSVHKKILSVLKNLEKCF